MKKTLRQCLLPVLLGCSGMAQAGLLNADFSQGFNHWQGIGYWTDPQANTNGVETNLNFSAYPASFALNAGILQLTTALSQQREWWSLLMFQDFTLQASSGQKVWLHINLQKQLSSPDDFYFVQLRDLDTNDALDLSAGGSFDVTAWAGRQLSLEFGVQDNDFVLGDKLQLTRLELQVQNPATTVDTPAGSWSVLTGLLLLAVQMRRRSKANRSVRHD